MPHEFRQGQAYTALGPGVWVVQAIFEGPGVIFADDKRVVPSLCGIMLLRNQELDYRAFVRLDDPRLHRLKRVK